MVATSKSRNETSSSTRYDTRTQNLNLQGLSGDGQVIAGSNNTVLDGGAIKALQDVSKTSVEDASNITLKSLDLSRDVFNGALSTSERATQNALQYVFDASQPETAQQKNLTQAALIGAAILAAAMVMSRSK